MKLLSMLALTLPAALVLPLHGAPPGACSEDLLGATLDVLRTELGAPVGVLAGDVLVLDYLDEEGVLVEGAVVVAGDIVVRAAPRLARATEAGPHRGLLLGGPLEVLAALGPAEEVTCGANLSTLYCEGWEVDMVRGRVVDVRPR